MRMSRERTSRFSLAPTLCISSARFSQSNPSSLGSSPAARRRNSSVCCSVHRRKSLSYRVLTLLSFGSIYLASETPCCRDEMTADVVYRAC